MNRASKRYKRTAAFLMAVWLLVSTGLVHSLHHHSSKPQLATEPRICAGPASIAEPICLAAESQAELGARRSSEYCIACLLVNTCNSGAIEWLFEPHYFNSDELTPHGSEAVCCSSRGSQQPPRAPPIFVS